MAGRRRMLVAVGLVIAVMAAGLIALWAMQ